MIYYTSKKKKDEDKAVLTRQSVEEKERERQLKNLANDSFNPTSTHDLSVRVPGTSSETICLLRFYVDSNSKKIALLNLKRNIRTIIDFDKILSCELVMSGQSTSSIGFGGTSGRLGVGVASSYNEFNSLVLKFTLKDIDNPTYEIELMGYSDVSLITAKGFGSSLTTSDPEYAAVVEFIEKVKAVVTNIIAMRE